MASMYCMHSRPYLCISVAIQAGLGFINHTLKIGFSHIILFSGYAGHSFVSDVAAAVTERAKACPSQQYLFLYTQTMETGVNL